MSEATSTMSTRPRSRGFTLLEVLIALVVLSIGLLGIAALQGVGLRSSHGAYLTSQASLLAYDMADRIRANVNEFAAAEATDEDGVPATNGSLAVTCDGNATSDIGQWACAVETLLPAGSGEISRTASGAVTTYVIRVEWEDRQAEEGEGPWSFELAIDI